MQTPKSDRYPLPRQFLMRLALAIAALILLRFPLATYADTFTTLYNFSAADGSPQALIQANDGNLYGTASGPGSDCGMVFRETPSGDFTVLTRLSCPEPSLLGWGPSATLIEAADGNFYGTTIGFPSIGSPYGTIFRLSPSGVLTTLHTFSGADGAFPISLTQGTDGDLYGVTLGHGLPNSNPYRLGTIFKISLFGAFATLHGFSGPDGATPRAGLIRGNDGSFYGTTEEGGFGHGTVFRITPSGNFTTLYRFSGSDGSSPEPALVEGLDGNFYGTTAYGVVNNSGTVFKLTPSGSLTVLHNFLHSDGESWAPLVIAADGNFYGNTHAEIFKLTPAGDFSISHSFSGSDGTPPFAGLIQGVDGKLYGITPDGGTSNNGTFFSLTIGNTAPALLSVHPVPAAALPSASTDGIDTALGVRTSDALLKTNQPSLTGGLVADGVTPLLIELDTDPAPTQATTFTLGITVTGGQLATGALDQYLRVLQQSGSNPQFVPGNSVVVSPSHPSGFAYISGIKSEDVQFAAGSKELTVTLCATKDGDTTPTATVSFRIRRPPIVLVHGYNSDNGAWYENDSLTVPNAFLSALQTSFPADFILPVEYGVDRSGNKADDSTNISGAFEYLAPLLDNQLRTYVENPASLWHQAWAFTRYNIVGHSQGGVLVRVLCTSHDPPSASFKPFRSDNNAYRGRFHRVITFNSPHNGSTLLRYLLTLKARHPDNVAISIIELFGDLIQPKFDPFPDDSQIKKIRNDWPADPGAKFHLIGTSIHGGAPPAAADVFPACYYETGLTRLVSGNHTRGWVVIPSGSDGVVDFSSEFAGSSSNKASAIVGPDISHSPPLAAFWDHPFSGITNATASATLGDMVAQLLNGQSSEFGGFVIQPVDPALGGQIDNTVPPVLTAWQLIQQFAPPTPTPMPGLRKVHTSSTSVYQYRIVPQSDQEPADPPSWNAKIFGPDGVITDGVTVTPDSNDPSVVSVTVDDSVVGDVVLYANYNDTNNNLIIGAPVVLVSRPPGNNVNGIELVPGSISLTVGSSVSPQIWSDYDNGARGQLYIAANAAISYSSEDSAVASVDATGKIMLNAPGTTNIHVSYLGFAAQLSVSVSAAPPPPVIAPLGAVTRKTHGEAGTFDIDLPLTGNPGIECRSGGASNSYQVIVTFAAPMTLSNVTIGSSTRTSATMNANVTGYSISGSQVLINIANLPNTQTSVITLSNVSDGGTPNDVVIPISLLIGDATGNGTVNSSDVSQVKLKSGQPVDATNFRADVNVNGTINATDVSQVKLNTGHGVP